MVGPSIRGHFLKKVMISLCLTFTPNHQKATATRILFYQIATPRIGREPLFRRTRPNLTDLVE
jgi:hypothetical protein